QLSANKTNQISADGSVLETLFSHPKNLAIEILVSFVGLTLLREIFFGGKPSRCLLRTHVLRPPSWIVAEEAAYMITRISRPAFEKAVIQVEGLFPSLRRCFISETDSGKLLF